MGLMKKIDTTITVVGVVTSLYKFMLHTFEWYNKKHGDKNKEIINKPIIKGAN